MNYLREINAFYDWLETNSLSTSGIALWYALMHINNKAGWIDEFAVAVSVLCVKTGLSTRAIYNARNELKIKGRLNWKARHGNQSAIYSLQPLCATDAGNTAHNTAGNHAGSSAGNTAPLNKLNKTKQNIYTPEFEKWYSAYPRPQAKRDSFNNFEKVRKEHGLDLIWKCTNNYIKHYNAMPEEKKQFAYAANNFLGNKKYYEDFMEDKHSTGGLRKIGPIKIVDR